mmetsp:Transcript_10051/g.18330  ORF Transcript_10051/g.18330 Transcript_10051/m.18330 type:complete len:111 (+) Transcript_10051:355-687(+)
MDTFSRRSRSISILDAFVGYGASWINLFNIGMDSAMQTVHSRNAKQTITQSIAIQVESVVRINCKIWMSFMMNVKERIQVYSPDKQSGRLSRKLRENGRPLWFTIVVTAF